MVEASSQPGRSMSLLDTRAFLDHDIAGGRLDQSLDGGVTVSAAPDGAGGTRWEARTADGRALRVFRLTMDAARRGPVVLPATPTSVYVCYEDEAQQKSWCIEVRTD